MVTSEGLVKILDFGLAKRTSPTASTLSGSDLTLEAALATEPGRLLGTVAYMSPEQARGLPLDFRSDQFAFGAILFEMLTGRRPFAGATTLDTLTAILQAEPAGITELEAQLPPPLVWVVRRCLAKDPAARYAATRDLAHELDTIRERMTEAGSLVGSGAIPIRRSPRLRRATLAAGVVGIAGLVVLAGAGLWHLRNFASGSGASRASAPEVGAKPCVALPSSRFATLTGTPAGERIGEGFAETVSVRLGGGERPRGAADRGARPHCGESGPGGADPRRRSRRGQALRPSCVARCSSRGRRSAPPSRSWTPTGGRSRPARPRGPRRSCSRSRTRSPPSPPPRSVRRRLARSRRSDATGAALRGRPLPRGARSLAPLRERSLGRRGDPHSR